MVEQDWDVVVIGAGGGGLSAAIAAADAGCRVVVLESEPQIGGSTNLSAGMFTAGGTSIQAALGVEDSAQRYFQHYMDLNQWRLNPGLVRSFCERSRDTLEWLLEIGVEIPAQRSSNAHMPGLTRAGVEDTWRGHVPAGEGYGLVQALDRARRERGVEVILDARAERLLVADGRVSGVVVDGVDLASDAVVVASGGLTRNPDLLARYYPDALLAGDALFVVSAPGCRGDHVGFAEQVGSPIVGQGWGMLLVTACFQTRHHWESGFPPVSRVLVDDAGRRFMDEDASYAVAAGIVGDHGNQAWMVFDEKARRDLPVGFVDWTPERVLEEVGTGRVLRADSLEALGAAMDVPASTFAATMQRWNATLPQGEDPEFLRHESLVAKGKAPAIDAIEGGPFYATRALPAELAVSHAGMRIDETAAVLDEHGDRVPGLYAAGEAAGGILGVRYVGGGNSIANALVNGRSAGQSAAARVSAPA